MRFFVLDPRGGDLHSDLYLVDTDRKRVPRPLRLGYVPEICTNAAAGELVVVDTEVNRASGTSRHWLTCYDAGSLKRRHRREVPERPMHAGYPGRSSRVTSSPSGRYVYVLESRMIIRHPADDIFRMTVHRYDRQGGLLEPGGPVIESCLIEFGAVGEDDDELYFHLSCDAPSTVAFGRFSSPDRDDLRLEETPPRMHSPQETCGSWLDRPAGALYCITGEGKIYRVRHRPRESTLLLHLPVAEPHFIPLNPIQGGGGTLFVAISASIEERSVGLASEVWQVSLADAAVVRVLTLPVPVNNFVVTPDGGCLVGVSPHEKRAFVLETCSGRVLHDRGKLGYSPAEVLLSP